jgi:hypothetical protein
MTAPSLESWFEVQLADAELNALEADLQDRLARALAVSFELNEYIADYIELYGEAGRLELQAQFEPYLEQMDNCIMRLEQQLAAYHELEE